MGNLYIPVSLYIIYGLINAGDLGKHKAFFPAPTNFLCIVEVVILLGLTC